MLGDQSNWTKISKLGEGGQGITYLVKNVRTDEVAVLKLLKKQGSQQARRRMYQEVSNLKVLASVSCKVPKVVESNVELFESDTELYFVMEHIEGQSLDKVISEKKRLGLDAAIQLTVELCEVLKAAAKELIFHRDLKPENIIIRSIDPPDAVIVDYGLSFRAEEDLQATRVGETLDNRFLSLPERRVVGGDRRDPRSDLTSLCGILHYCICGLPPVDLVDARGLLPHRRPEPNLADLYGADPRFSQSKRGQVLQSGVRSCNVASRTLETLLVARCCEYSPQTPPTMVGFFIPDSVRMWLYS
ncbi:MAG: protein kinase [Burkholderiales bacterium]|nr:protein kinase [Burkholderiales bacterium]